MITRGIDSMIDPSAQISPDVNLIMGDCSSIGPGVVVSGGGTLKIGDYVRIHRLVWINCHSDVDVGHNSWIGEKSIIDGTARLVLGNNVAIGTGSQVWSHVSFGDAFSGCRFRSSKAVTLADEAWLCGPVLLQSSNIASRVVVMGGSNVTSDIDTPNSIWSGNPVTDRTEYMGGPPWVEPTVEQKRRRFDNLLLAYGRAYADPRDYIACVDSLAPSREQNASVTYFEMKRRIYTKRGTDAERAFMKWLLKHNKAKFTPVP